MQGNGDIDKCLVFGVAGIPLSTPHPDYIHGLEKIAEVGLHAMELSFVQFVNMSEETAKQFFLKKTELATEGKYITVSVHAPYFINLNAKEGLKIEESIERILKSAVRGKVAGATNIVFHPGFYVGMSPEDTYTRVKSSVEALLARYHQLVPGERPVLRPETTGKPTQFGSLSELLALCREFDELLPCIDFAHLHARTNGGVNSYQEFCTVLDTIHDMLGDRGLKNLHIHYSGIAYSEKGEKKHLPLKKSDADYQSFMRALKEYHVAGEIICESPVLEEDALLLEDVYQRI